MSRETEKTGKTQAQAGRVCRVSYLLNNDQPVRSTIIGDQPLFYMDFDALLEDELAALEMLETELSLMGVTQPEHETGYGGPEESIEEVIERFQCNAGSLLGKGDTGPEAEMQEVLGHLRSSRYAAALHDFAKEYGVRAEFCEQVENAAYIRRENLIQINPFLHVEEQVLLLARELRRVWQHRNGALVHPLTFHPDQAILVNRAQVADLVASMVRAAWELQLGGYRSAWERVESSPMSDFAKIFAREAFLDFRTLNNGMAMAAAFETWFISERCRVEDKHLIQQMLSDYQGYVFETEEGSRTVTAELLTGLGQVPFGKNYLASYAAAIILDPLFTDVRDRANANFLWFIKFEKSFRETEQELQSASGSQSHSFMDGSSEDQSKDSVYETAENVITLYADSDRDGYKKIACNSGATGSDDATVIAFPRRMHRE